MCSNTALAMQALRALQKRRPITLSVFGVGRRTVGHRPGGGSRSSGAPTTAAGSLSVAADGGDALGRRRRRGHKTSDNVTSHRLRSQVRISDRFPHPSNYFR